MRFKNNRQRAAVMSKYRSMGFSPISAKYYTKKGISPSEAKNSTFKQLSKKGIWLKYSDDKDGDGIRNIKDCRPLDPKRVGMLHDWQMKRLKKQEEKLESKREVAQKKLEDIKDELKQRSEVSSKKVSIRQLELQKKQAVIDEINKEKAQLDDIRQAEVAAKKEMDKYTWTGKAKSVLSKAGEKASAAGSEAKRRWNTPESRENRRKAKAGAGKALKKIWKVLK